MLILSVLLLTLVPQSENKLTISKVRPTLVGLGPTRPDTDFQPGDVMHVTFDVAGFMLDTEGRYRYSAKVDVENSAGKLVFSEDYGSSPARLALLGNGKTRFAFHLPIPADQPSGNYKVRLTLTDTIGKKTGVLEQPYRVLSPRFGLVRLQTLPSSCIGTVGEVFNVGMQAINLAKNSEGLGHLELTLEVKDSNGKVLGKPQVNSFKDVSVNEPLLLRFELPLDQAGKFQLVFKGVDKVNGRSATVTVPINVIE
ncbi:MAG TPA: hypothetical protein PLX97_06725 [Gemmatales bacterium]|nr:hypothetical protein [Gemmatales bacterium]